MSERRPRLNKKLNSNDRKAMLRIKTVLPRNCIAVLQALKLNTFGRARERPHQEDLQVAYFMKDYQEQGGRKLRKFALRM